MAEPEPVAEAPAAPEEPKPAAEASTGLKVLGKIELSQFEAPKKSKRERITEGGSQKVDVTKINVAQPAGKDGKKNGKNGQQVQNAPGTGKRNRGKDRFKAALTPEEEERLFTIDGGLLTAAGERVTLLAGTFEPAEEE